MALPFSYQIIRSDRRTLGIEIKDGAVLVRAPRRASVQQIEQLLQKKQTWILTHLSHAQQQAAAAKAVTPLTEAQLQILLQNAAAEIPPRVARYAAQLGVTYGRITIRCQKTRWGSCSSKGNLNFNCLLMLAPPEVLDSVIVHELCHRKEMNHSPRFYALVHSVYPAYDHWHNWLKAHGSELLARIQT